MAVKIRFDSSNTPETPTFILALNNGEKLGKIDAININMSDNLNEASEISFKVNKIKNGIKNNLWDEITNFRLIWCREYDLWYQIKVEISDSDGEITKDVSGIQLGQAELSQIMLFDIEINTEDDIAREDYKIPTILYRETQKEASLLDRLLEKAPHYHIQHVDSTIKNIQRTFSFDNKSIQDAFNEIAEEIGCLFVYHSNSTQNGNINRAISVYDIQSTCNSCGYRGEYTGHCPKCNSSDINEGYGKDTTIFVSSDELGNDITFSTDTDSVKNCFKLEAGDDLMTATIRNCNPNGSDYIWYLSDDLKKSMSKGLVDALKKYGEKTTMYTMNYMFQIDNSLVIQYNNLIDKYSSYKSDLKKLSRTFRGYQNLITIYYDTIDFNLFLTSEFMPTVEMSDTTASDEAKKLTSSNLSPVSVQNISSVSLSTANSAVLAMAKVLINSTYKVEIKTSSLNNLVWTGVFTITNYSSDEDKAETQSVSVIIDGNYELFIKQKIEKLLNKHNDTDMSITGLFDKEYDDFCNELKKYCLNKLTAFHDACQSCIDILIEQGISDNKTWADSDPNLYNDLYTPYLKKLSAIESEMKVRENEINIISGTETKKGIQDALLMHKQTVQKELDLQSVLGNELWLELCTYRREDKYSNDNYVSDGLSNSELLEKANEFLNTAQKEIYKSAEMQHSISCSLKNLLVIKKFEKLLDYFEVGNWLRIKVDEDIYKLRLLSYEIDYDNLSEISVDFSDVMKTIDGLSDQRSIIKQASSMATSYDYVKKQVSKNEKDTKNISSLFDGGLDATNTKIIGGADEQTQTWDNHGMLFRRYNSITDNYDDIQLKIINSTIAITDDNWKSTKTAIGNFYYKDFETNELKSAYGINGEVIVGRLLLGEELGIYNSSGSLTFDSKGLNVTNGTNTFSVNPNSSRLFVLNNNDSDVFYVDTEGNGYFKGSITATSGSFGKINPFIIGDYGIDGSISSNQSTSSITTTSQYNLYKNNSYSNDFNIVVTKNYETDEINNIDMTINIIDLVVTYSYEIQVKNDKESTDDSNNFGSTTESETTTEYYSSTLSINLISSNTKVTGISVSLNKNTRVKTYTYTYTITSTDMLSYLKKKIIDNNSEVQSATSLTINSVVAVARYTYNFTSYNSYCHIGTDYFDYYGLLRVSYGHLDLGYTNINGSLTISDNVYMGENTFITGTMASNDSWRILGGGSNDYGYFEVATADNGNDPIYVRQYYGNFQTINNTLTLLNENGDTILPKGLYVGSIYHNKGGTLFLGSNVETAGNINVGSSYYPDEQRVTFSNMNANCTYKHHTYLYGGNGDSKTGIGLYDYKNKRCVLIYNDVDNGVDFSFVDKFLFNDYSGTARRPIASTTTDGSRVSHMATNSTQLRINAQWGNGSLSTRSISLSGSDIRLKENFADCNVNALDFIDKIKLYSFDWKKEEGGNHQKIGFIADELEKLDNMLVNGGGYNEDGTMDVKCINDFYLMGYVVKAIKELRQENKELKEQLKER